MKNKKRIAVLLVFSLVIGLIMSAVPTTAAYQDSNSAYSLKGMSNYCANTAEYSGAEKGTHTLEFVAPADLDIVSFQFELFRDTSNASLGNYSSFTKQMAYNPAVSEDGLTVLRGSFSDINSYSVSKGDVLLTAEINMDINISEADSRDAIICFQVLDLQVRTPDGDVVLIRNGTIQEPTYKPEPETEPETRDGTRDPTENPTGYCTPETEFFIFGYSNYCKEIERFGGRLCEREHFTFKAPDNLNIIKMKFKLNYNIDYDHPYDPSAFSDKVEYTKKTDTDNPYLKDKYYTGGSFASNTPVSVNKGQTLLEFDVTAGPFEYFEMGEYVDDELCFEVTELIVEENGVKMYIVKDSKVLGEPVPFEPEVPTTETAAVIGDVNRNGIVDIDDATMIQKHLAEFKNADGTPIIDIENEQIKQIADVDRDGSIGVKDVTMIQQRIAEFIDSFD